MSKTLLFLLGDCPGNYVPLMNALAERLFAEECRIIVAATTPYYEEYTNVDFSKYGEVFYLSEFLAEFSATEELKKVELDYWNVYPTYVRDHYFSGRHRNDWDTYKKVVVFFNEIYKSQNIDLVISEPPSNSFLYIGYSQAQIEAVQFMGFMPARIPRHINVFLDVYGQKLLINPVDIGSVEKLNLGPPDYMLPTSARLFKGLAPTRLWFYLRNIFVSSLETGSTVTHQLKSVYKKHLWRRLRFLRVRMARVFEQDVDSTDTINILFPLHYRPEASTSVLARYYENDLELIKNIAFSMTSNSKLIVKEHASALGIRNLRFYRQVLSLPNTLLLAPEFNVASNLSKFDAVITLTSTVGFEAVQVGVPVFLLGNTFYANYSGVVKIDSYRQLEQILKNLSKNKAKPNAAIMRRYIKYCFPGQFSYMDDKVLQASNITKLLVPIRELLAD